MIRFLILATIFFVTTSGPGQKTDSTAKGEILPVPESDSLKPPVLVGTKELEKELPKGNKNISSYVEALKNEKAKDCADKEYWKNRALAAEKLAVQLAAIPPIHDTLIGIPVINVTKTIRQGLLPRKDGTFKTLQASLRKDSIISYDTTSIQMLYTKQG